ncbi:MAG: hypothetical protein KY476_03795 [Planctomycetes bacterium]|nr:hypothetical protein [Planctomycetota bacterium]
MNIVPRTSHIERNPSREGSDRWRVARIAAAALVLLAWLVTPARAVIVDLKNGSSVAGYLVSHDANFVIVKPLRNAPESDWKRYPAADVQAVRSYVDLARLQALDPSRPDAYRDYAEELLEKRKDPEARDTAVRLYLIAARLDPARLGRPALLGVKTLAETPEERRGAAMLAYLFDPAHDASLLDEPADPPAVRRTEPAERRYAESLAAFREGRLRDAAAQAQRPGVAELFDRHGPFGHDSFVARLVDAECPLCAKGYVTCANCKGRGCAACGGTGLSTACARCSPTGGRGETPRHRPSLSDAELAAVIRRELAVLTGGPSNSVDDSRPWSVIVNSGGEQPVRPLSLETLTPFDPRQSVFRNGSWMEP